MDYQSFLTQIQSAGVKLNEFTGGYYNRDFNSLHSDLREKIGHYVEVKSLTKQGKEKVKKEFVSKFDFLGEYWETGGADGGSCYDEADAEDYYLGDKEKPKSFVALDKILGVLCANISFLEYKKLEDQKDIIVEVSYTDYEYYGNRTDYSCRYVNLGKLWEYLTNNKLVAQPVVKFVMPKGQPLNESRNC